MIPVPPRVFLDANILFSRTLRDWISLLSLEGYGLAYDLRYSEDVLAEWVYQMRRKRPEYSDHAIGGQRRQFVAAFPDGLVTGYDVDAVPAPPDPHDRHVLAAAVHGAVNVLVTEDRNGFPAECVQGRLDVSSADEFLVDIADNDLGLVGRVAEVQLDYYRSSVIGSGRDEAGLVSHLRKAGAPEFAQRVEDLFSAG